MALKEEMRNMSSTDDEVEETLTETFSIEEASMTRAKVKMEEVRQENERLKLTLSQMMKDYQSLKMKFNGITRESIKKATTNLASMAASDDESELVSLSLGLFSVDSMEKKKKFINGNNYKENNKTLENDKVVELGLNNCELDSDNSLRVSRNLKRENSYDESKEEARSCHDGSPKNSRNGDDDILQHTTSLKKPRVSVKAVCNTQTMHDGCQWRKYGQKIAKGNPCPRAYYRCTVSSSCPVRKQVQRCIDDMTILITTYEGSHDHPIPASAAAMASATSSAMAMLSCGSHVSPSTNQNYPLGRATIASSQLHPTVILDLTPPNHSSNKLSPSSTTTSLFSSLPTSSKFSFINNNALSQPAAPISLFSSKRNPANVDGNIAAATEAITHHPNFRSALAAAITSFVGNNNNSNTSVNGGGGRNSGMDFHLNFSQPAASANNNALGCAASFINRFPQ